MAFRLLRGLPSPRLARSPAFKRPLFIIPTNSAARSLSTGIPPIADYVEDALPIDEDPFDEFADDDGPPRADPSFFPVRNPLTETKNIQPSVTPEITIIQHHLNVACTPNNTKAVLTNEKGCILERGSWSGGSCGFKGVNRSGYEAGYQCAVRAFGRMEELVTQMPGVRFEILFKGFGQGRDAVYKALMTSEGEKIRPLINRITDNTPIKIGGTRARKMRRL